MQPDPLQQLRDVHLPGLPSWWPPAPGWWLLALALLCLSIWLARKLWRYQQQRQPFRTAQRLHQKLCSELAHQQITPEEYLHEANALLKRTFVHVLGERDSAAMTGTEWLAYLNQFVDGEPFTSGIGSLLTQARFAPARQLQDPAALASLQEHIGAALVGATRHD